jgi:phosphoglycerol transferase MdoB-like AlkP superfamily enzyme
MLAAECCTLKPGSLVKILRGPVLLALLFLVTLSASRLLLAAVFWERVAATHGLGFILLQGVRFDLILVGMLIGPVLILKPITQSGRWLLPAAGWFWPLYLGLVSAWAFFVEASTVSFIREYDSRPNYIFVEYLGYPKELISTLAGSHLLELVAFNLLTLLIFWVVFRWARKDPANSVTVPLRLCLLTVPLTAILVVMMVRSTLDHRPVNPSIAAFSPDSMVNQLALNSPYSLLYAIYEQRRDARDSDVRYGAMEESEVFQRILQETGRAADNLDQALGPTLHLQEPSRATDRPRNIVIVLEESLGAEFVGSLGGKPLTPRLDAAADDGIWFERLYATGTRSVRGIEAVVTGITPTARRSVVKLRETQDDFFTLAGLLKEHGYETSFIYGGEAHFDNMRRFFLNNGFDTVIDEKDYDSPEFVAVWGVSDEDLFNRADEQFRAAGDRPFFSLVFTSSNHDPFDIPAGRVTPETGPDGPRETAVKYADYAVGEFLERARQSPYWDNTVILVIADHNSRVYGDALVPIERFHIPGLIVGGGIQPRRVPDITSQIDMLPTLLSLAGVRSRHPGIGRDISSPEFAAGAGRAMMQFNRVVAFMVPGRVVVLQPDLPPLSFLYEPDGDMLTDPDPDPELERTALAYTWFAPLMIQRHWYRNATMP